MGFFSAIGDYMAAADRIRKKKDVEEVFRTAVRTLKSRAHTNAEIAQELNLTTEQVMEYLISR